YFLTTNHITAISRKASIEYNTISDIRELITTGTVTGARGIS
ncbi:2563_t:CDS:1, partial [Funneliformis mosseae]